MSDTLEVFGKTWTGVEGFKATDNNGVVQTYSKGGSATVLDENGITVVEAEEPVVPASGYNGSITVSKTPVLTHSWDFTQSLVDSVSGVTATLANGATQSSSGITISGSTQYVSLGERYAHYKTYEIDVTSFSKSFSSGHGRFIMATNSEGFILQNGTTWNCYLDSAWCGSGGTNLTVLDGKTVRLRTGDVRRIVRNGSTLTRSFWDISLDGTLWYCSSVGEAAQSSAPLTIGSTGGASLCTLVVTGARIYDGVTYD